MWVEVWIGTKRLILNSMLGFGGSYDCGMSSVGNTIEDLYGYAGMLLLGC